ncbi:uncharacterized protein [Brachionichthys hirsutus]|uniref:uncharacterized protein n=1 Tax=Brachionichthys hirsutus TaxID=412623 RepID=UPI003604DFEF
MSKKIARCSPVDREERDQPPGASQVERSVNRPESSQRNGGTASSSPENGSLNGNGKRSGKTRHRNRKRVSNPEGCPEETETKTKSEERPVKRPGLSRSVRAGLVDLQAECANVWFERSLYERAESLYQCWLASSSNRTPPAPGNPPKSPSPPSSGPLCRHGDRVACHHVVEAVWVNKTTFDQAEWRFVEEALPSIPKSLDCSGTARTPDEGYRSPAPTPVVQPPADRQPGNELPRVPVELLRDVWLEKPLYDRAEAAFYQNLYGSNSSKRSSCASPRSSDHPQSLVEEEEEDEEEEEAKRAAVEEKRLVLQGKAEIFHALLPIQEEEEPVEVPEKEEAPGAGAASFAHPDSEPVWLDKWRYDAAENRFHVYNQSKGPRPAVASAAAAPPRDKYEQTGGVEALLMFHFDFH